MSVAAVERHLLPSDSWAAAIETKLLLTGTAVEMQLLLYIERQLLFNLRGTWQLGSCYSDAAAIYAVAINFRLLLLTSN